MKISLDDVATVTALETRLGPPGMVENVGLQIILPAGSDPSLAEQIQNNPLVNELGKLLCLAMGNPDGKPRWMYSVAGYGAGMAREMTLQSVIKAHVLEVFYQNNGNYTHTAKALGVGLRTLRGWLNEDLWPYDHCTRAESREARCKEEGR